MRAYIGKLLSTDNFYMARALSHIKRTANLLLLSLTAYLKSQKIRTRLYRMKRSIVKYLVRDWRHPVFSRFRDAWSQVIKGVWESKAFPKSSNSQMLSTVQFGTWYVPFPIGEDVRWDAFNFWRKISDSSLVPLDKIPYTGLTLETMMILHNVECYKFLCLYTFSQLAPKETHREWLRRIWMLIRSVRECQ